MTPEDRQALYKTLEGLGRIESKLDSFEAGLRTHEATDKDAHDKMSARMGKVEKKQTQLGAYYAAACVLLSVLWALGWLVKASASAA